MEVSSSDNNNIQNNNVQNNNVQTNNSNEQNNTLLASNNSNNYDIRIPPILPIKHLVNQYETKQTANKNMLKLYRKKPLLSEKKSITSSMNLIIDSEE